LIQKCLINRFLITRDAISQQSLKLVYTLYSIDWNLEYKFEIFSARANSIPIGTKLIKTKRSRYKSRVTTYHDIGNIGIIHISTSVKLDGANSWQQLIIINVLGSDLPLSAGQNWWIQNFESSSWPRDWLSNLRNGITHSYTKYQWADHLIYLWHICHSRFFRWAGGGVGTVVIGTSN